MKNAGVFLGSLGLMITCNLMLISACVSSPPPVSAAPPPPPPPTPVVKIAPKPPTIEIEAPPLGLMVWGCGAYRSLGLDDALPLPICAPLLRF